MRADQPVDKSPAVEGPRYPITGVICCCARAAIGHAAAPLSTVMNERLFNRLDCICCLTQLRGSISHW